jgi:hypothetical protein
MATHPPKLARRFTILFLAASLLAPQAGAYSVLTHEEVVDMAWKDTIVPMLQARFPGITPDDIRAAHAYAYGGSVIQDIGYYPFGSHYFSDLLHYVRPEVFVENLIHDSTTPDEYAFALGALAHYCGDTIGHPAVNVVDAQQNPKLEQKYGPVVTYAEDPTAHLRTEFGFDVVEVSQGHYSQDNYRDFIGFQVAKPLLDKAFAETYGIPADSVLTHEDLAINTYRKAVSKIIPNLTVVAFTSYRKQIQQAAPSVDKSKFIYRLKQTEYEKDYGTDYTHLSFGGRILAAFLRIMPKVGPFRSLKVTIANPQQQDVYLKSVNSTVDQYKLYLAQITAAPAPLPPPSEQDAAAARDAAAKLQKDSVKVNRAAAKAGDPADKAKKEKAAQHVDEVAAKISISADQKTAAVSASTSPIGPTPTPAGALPPGSPIAAPTSPALPHLDLDTGRPYTAGEYKLADEAYAHLLADLVKPVPVKPLPISQSTTARAPASNLTASNGPPMQISTSIQSTPAPLPAAPADGATPRVIDPALASNIETFFAHPIARTGPAATEKEAGKEAALAAQVKTNLQTLKSLVPPATTPLSSP